MAKIYKNVNGDYIEVEQSLNPDTLAAKLTQDPIYRFISKDQEQTSQALTLLFLGFMILPFATSAIIWFNVSKILGAAFMIFNLACMMKPRIGVPIIILIHVVFYYFVDK